MTDKPMHPSAPPSARKHARSIPSVDGCCVGQGGTRAVILSQREARLLTLRLRIWMKQQLLDHGISQHLGPLSFPRG
jgi:hypothetical protein